MEKTDILGVWNCSKEVEFVLCFCRARVMATPGGNNKTEGGIEMKRML